MTLEMLNIFNSFHSRLQFTIEFGNDKLDFLDVTIIKNNKFEFDWFHKSTFSNRHLNFYSQYLFTQKQGTIINVMESFYCHTVNLKKKICVLYSLHCLIMTIL